MKNIYTILFLVFSLSAVSQSSSIKGRIVTSDGFPAAAVNIELKNSSYKTVSDKNGAFSITTIVPGKYNLFIYFSGLESKEIPVDLMNTQELILDEIILKENKNELNEVIIKAQRNYRREISQNVNRLEIKNLENPQSIQIIGQELIKDRQIQTVAEAIKSMVGVNAFSSSQYSDYVLRGFRSNAGNFAYNGIRGDLYSFDQASLTYNLESIEAIKGPASVLFSAGNPGGIINHVTKKAKAIPRYEIEYTLGSFDQNRFMADATGPLSKDKKILYRLIAGYENTGQLDRNQRIKNFFLAPQLQFNFSENTTINYELNFNSDRRRMGYERGVPALHNPDNKTWDLERYPIDFSMIDPNGYSKTISMSNQIVFSHRFNGKLKFTTLLRSSETVQEQADLSPRNFMTGAENDIIPLINNYGKATPQGYQSSSFVNFKHEIAKMQHEMVAGFDYSFSYNNYVYGSLEKRDFNLNNPEFGWGVYDYEQALAIYKANPRTDSNPTGYDAPYAANESTYLTAFYFQDQISITQQLKLLLGGRYESHRFNQNFKDVTNNATTGTDNLEAEEFIPRAGIVFLPNEAMSVYFSYSRGFQPQTSSGLEAGGPFDPERSVQYEVGSKREWFNNRLLTTVSLYYIEKYNVLANDPTNSEERIRLITIDNVKSKGIEISAQGKITDELNVMVNYAYNEATTPGDGGYSLSLPGWFPNAPNTNANAWLKYTFSTTKLKNLGIGAGFNYLSKRSTFIEGFEVPEYTTVDAALSYKIKNINLSANIYNITNTRYWSGVYGPANLWPGRPTSFRITLNYAF
ncbi:MAG TPA: TonB-dependent siderophore receptor [Flavobacterium sp.]|jgi:iron complex outermembrane receptor protein